jgi:TPR repeat protein
LAADQKHLQAQVWVAFCYEYGEGVVQSDTQAFYYYQLAAEQGLTSAQACLGKFYAEDKGLEKSYEKALHRYEIAAEQGGVLAWKYLAEYRQGLVLEPSESKANYYLQQRLNHLKAKAAVGNITAQMILGREQTNSLKAKQADLLKDNVKTTEHAEIRYLRLNASDGLNAMLLSFLKRLLIF